MDTCEHKEISQTLLQPKYFAEGITRVGEDLYQLTYREQEIIKWKLSATYSQYKEEDPNSEKPLTFKETLFMP